MKFPKLLIGAVLSCLLLVAITAHASTVERDGVNNENVSAIRDLELGGLLYDVEFLNYPAASIYPGDPPNFDFDTSQEAGEAHNAVIAVLNAEGGVSEVGRSTDSGVAFFRIAYAFTEKTINFNFWFFDINQQIRFVAIWEATTDNPDLGSTTWINTNQDLWPYLDDGNYAQFTVVGTAGTGNLPPTADANGPYAGTVGETVSFDSTGSSDPDGPIAAYNWDFGDDNTGTGETPSHIYSEAGIYYVTLTVTDDSGVPASDVSTAEIGSTSQPPVADAGGPYTGTVGAPVSFDGTASSDPEGPIATYSWDFGDGGIGTGVTPSYPYTASGNYNVTLIVTDNSGETATDVSTAQIAVGNQPPRANAGAPVTGVVAVAVSFDGTGSSDSDGDIAAYDWDFGDDNTGTGITLSHTYSTPDNYIVTLTVTDDGGAIDSTITAAAIDATNQPPVADAGGPYKGTVGAPVSFDGTASSDPDGDIVTYNWDFGDGGIGTGVTPSYPYTASGNYNVTLTVTDDSGETATDISTAQIGVGYLPPIATPGSIPPKVVGKPVVFDGSGSSDPDGTIANYTWDFGDGNTGTGENTTHVYDAVGKYIVILKVTDDSGLSDSFATVALVLDPSINYPPEKPILTVPANGAVVDLGGTGVTTLRWEPTSDPNDDVVSYEVYLCTDSEPLINCASTQAAYFNSSGEMNVIYASVVPVDISKSPDLRTMALMGVLACIVLMGLVWKTRSRITKWMLLTLSVALIVSCSDGGGGGISSSSSADASYLASGLSPGTTYHWAVVAKDDQGGETASDTRTFSTQ
jgi:PKD repeat protein